MDINFAIKLLDILTENGARVLAAGFGVNWAEGSFFEVVRLLKQESILKEYFLAAAKTTLSMRAPEQLPPGTTPVELIELVAHELRWPELLDLAQERIDEIFGGDAALAIGDVAERLPDAYHDDWNDREFYRTYGEI